MVTRRTVLQSLGILGAGALLGTGKESLAVAATKAGWVMRCWHTSKHRPAVCPNDEPGSPGLNPCRMVLFGGLAYPVCPSGFFVRSSGYLVC